MATDTMKRNRRSTTAGQKLADTIADKANGDTAIATGTVDSNGTVDSKVDTIPAADRAVTRSDNMPPDDQIVIAVGDKLPMSAEDVSRQYRLAFAEDAQGVKLQGNAGKRMAAAIMGQHAVWTAMGGSHAPAPWSQLMAGSEGKAFRYFRKAIQIEFGGKRLKSAKIMTALDNSERIEPKVYAQRLADQRAHDSVINRGMTLAFAVVKAKRDLTCYDMTTGQWTLPMRALCKPGTVASPSFLDQDMALDGRYFSLTIEAKDAAGNIVSATDTFTASEARVRQVYDYKPPAVVAVSSTTGNATEGRDTQLPGANGSKMFGGENLDTMPVAKLTGDNGLHLGKAIEVTYALLKEAIEHSGKDAPLDAMAFAGRKDRNESMRIWNMATEIAKMVNDITSAPSFNTVTPKAKAA